MRACLRPLVALALLLAALPGVAAGQDLTVRITHAEALRDPPSTLATRAVGPFGERYVEVTRPFLAPREPEEEVWSLTFATRPQATSEPGICEAGVLKVDFRPPGWAMPPQPFETYTVYRVVADTARDSGWRSPGLNRPDPCAAAGPVIQSGRREDEGKPIYFRFEADNDAWVWHGVRGLRLALAAAQTSTPPCKPTFEDDPGYGCAALTAFAARANLDQLIYLEADFCQGSHDRLCVSATLRLPERRWGDETVILSFDVDPFGPGQDVADLRNLTVGKPLVIYD